MNTPETAARINPLRLSSKEADKYIASGFTKDAAIDGYNFSSEQSPEKDTNLPTNQEYIYTYVNISRLNVQQWRNPAMGSTSRKWIWIASKMEAPSPASPKGRSGIFGSHIYTFSFIRGDEGNWLDVKTRSSVAVHVRIQALVCFLYLLDYRDQIIWGLGYIKNLKWLQSTADFDFLIYNVIGAHVLSFWWFPC